MKHRPLINAYICAILILVACMLPGSDIPKVEIKLIHTDKIVHFLMYVTLVWTLAFGFQNQKSNSTFNKNHIVLSFIIACTFGALIEFLQYALTTDRACEFLDLLADTLGAITGLLTYKLGKRLILFWNSIFN